MSYPNQDFTLHLGHKYPKGNCEYCAPFYKVFPQSIDNYFSANHRSNMIALHKGTMAQIYTVQQFEEDYESL